MRLRLTSEINVVFLCNPKQFYHIDSHDRDYIVFCVTVNGKNFNFLLQNFCNFRLWLPFIIELLFCCYLVERTWQGEEIRRGDEYLCSLRTGLFWVFYHKIFFNHPQQKDIALCYLGVMVGCSLYMLIASLATLIKWWFRFPENFIRENCFSRAVFE